jgi:hypothetical protein
MQTEMNQVNNGSDSALSFDEVIGVLNDALRLFGEGDDEQACLCLAEANRLFDSCLTGGRSEAGVTPISVANSIPRRSVEVEESAEEAVLATIA